MTGLSAASRPYGKNSWSQNLDLGETRDQICRAGHCAFRSLASLMPEILLRYDVDGLTYTDAHLGRSLMALDASECIPCSCGFLCTCTAGYQHIALRRF